MKNSKRFLLQMKHCVFDWNPRDGRHLWIQSYLDWVDSVWQSINIGAKWVTVKIVCIRRGDQETQQQQQQRKTRCE